MGLETRATVTTIAVVQIGDDGNLGYSRSGDREKWMNMLMGRSYQDLQNKVIVKVEGKRKRIINDAQIWGSNNWWKVEPFTETGRMCKEGDLCQWGLGERQDSMSLF